MAEHTRVDEFLTSLLAICKPLDSFEMPLLDAHGATLSQDVFAGERLVMKAGSRIRSTQIGLAASIGLDHLPTRPHPRVVVMSAGPDLVEPGKTLKDDEEFETNSWMLTTAVREVGAVAYRVHSIPDDEAQLQNLIEDQLVRADLIIISGERHDDSFDLITRTISNMGEITTVDMAIEMSGRHNFGLIGPDKTPIVTLPGDHIGNYLSAEIFIRPMILKMLANNEIKRPSKKAKLSKSVNIEADKANYIRGRLKDDGSVEPLENQGSIATLSLADCLITLGEKDKKVSSGDLVNIIMID